MNDSFLMGWRCWVYGFVCFLHVYGPFVCLSKSFVDDDFNEVDI